MTQDESTTHALNLKLKVEPEPQLHSHIVTSIVFAPGRDKTTHIGPYRYWGKINVAIKGCVYLQSWCRRLSLKHLPPNLFLNRQWHSWRGSMNLWWPQLHIYLPGLFLVTRDNTTLLRIRTKKKSKGLVSPPCNQDKEGHPKQNELNAKVNRSCFGQSDWRYGLAEEMAKHVTDKVGHSHSTICGEGNDRQQN